MTREDVRKAVLMQAAIGPFLERDLPKLVGASRAECSAAMAYLCLARCLLLYRGRWAVTGVGRGTAKLWGVELPEEAPAVDSKPAKPLRKPPGQPKGPGIAPIKEDKAITSRRNGGLHTETPAVLAIRRAVVVCLAMRDHACVELIRAMPEGVTTAQGGVGRAVKCATSYLRRNHRAEYGKTGWSLTAEGRRWARKTYGLTIAEPAEPESGRKRRAADAPSDGALYAAHSARHATPELRAAAERAAKIAEGEV